MSGSRDAAAAVGSRAKDDSPGWMAMKVSYSSAGAGPQLLNLYTWMREPVDPASMVSAYWTSGESSLCGREQWVVNEGSGSVSYELAWPERTGESSISITSSFWWPAADGG